MAVYMLVGSQEPTLPVQRPSSPQKVAADSDALSPVDSVRQRPAGSELQDQVAQRPPSTQSWLTRPYRIYPWVYTTKVVLTLLAMVLVWRGYQAFPVRVSGLSVCVGVVGVVLWIALCQLRLEPKIIGPVDRFLGGFIPGLEEGDTASVGLMGILDAGERSAFNPLEQLSDSPAWAYAFLAIRFFGLAMLVPVMEEFFLRGFLMRYVQHETWWQLPLGEVNRMAVVVGTLVPMLMHPGELLAAFVWFSMVTWLMVRTRNIWDCVVAHAVTNFLLGVYVVVWDQWQLM
ncbi:MAG: CAAX prenyl protease-related protein [Pirellulales bacterium]|nr:CAAX prenyl protease-related protein [Pirellulales bacterium]